jgi:hypothetical protein
MMMIIIIAIIVGCKWKICQGMAKLRRKEARHVSMHVFRLPIYANYQMGSNNLFVF